MRLELCQSEIIGIIKYNKFLKIYQILSFKISSQSCYENNMIKYIKVILKK